MHPALCGTSIRYVQKRLLKWGRANFADFPWRRNGRGMHGLVAEMLLQRTRAEQVVPVYLEFVHRFPDSKSLADSNVDDIERVIRSLGLRWRARFIKSLAQRLLLEPDTAMTSPETLRALPGVGPYVASAFLSLHCGKRAAIVDSNVIRFYGRFWGLPVKDVSHPETYMRWLAEHLTPRRVFKDYNYAVIDFTRAVCRPRPCHDVCPVRKRCRFYNGYEGPQRM